MNRTLVLGFIVPCAISLVVWALVMYGTACWPVPYPAVEGLCAF